MRYFLTTFLLFLTLLVSAQGFRKRHYLPNASNNTAKNIYEISPGNYIAGGIIVEAYNGNTSNRLCITGLNSQGQILWTKKYGDYQFEYLDNLSITRWFYRQGNYLYYSAGARDANNKYVGVLIKFDFNGDTLWQKIYRDTQEDVIPQRVTGSVDGGFLITGFFQNWSNNTDPALLIKTDANGNELWRKKVHKPFPDVQDGRAIVQDSSSKKIIIVGYQYIGSASSWTDYDNVLILDSLGILQNRINYTSRGLFHDMIQTKDKKIVAVGHTFFSQLDQNTDLIKSFAIKIDLNNIFTPIWRLNNFDQASPTNYFTCLSELPDGNLILGGSIDTVNLHNFPENCLTRLTTLSPNGTVLRNLYFDYKTNGPTDFNEQRVLCLNPTSDNGLVAAIECFNQSPNPFFIVKFDSTGCDSTLAYCADLNAVGIPKVKTILGKLDIYPNPAKDILAVDIEDGGTEKGVTICFTDAFGQEVKRVKLQQGNNRIDVSELSAGIYIINVSNSENKILGECKFIKQD